MPQEFTLEDLILYLDLFDELELDIWIDGGWGVDALLGKQTRRHEDLDFLIEASDSPRLVAAIRKLGFIDVHTDDHTPWNFVMGTPGGTSGGSLNERETDAHVLPNTAVSGGGPWFGQWPGAAVGRNQGHPALGAGHEAAHDRPGANGKLRLCFSFATTFARV